MVFMGGAVLANIMKDKESFWMTRAEYEEKGLKVLDKLVGGTRWTNIESFLFWNRNTVITNDQNTN